MHQADKRDEEVLFNLFHFLQRKRALAQLAVVHLALHDLSHHLGNLLARGVGHGTHRRFTAVRQHHDGALLGTGQPALIAEQPLDDGFAVLLLHLLCLVVEIRNQRRSVVFIDDFADFGRHAVAGKIRLRVLEVRYDEARAFFRRKGVVNIAAVLIFLKVERAAQFANIMIHGSRSRQQRVCANGFRRAFRQRRRHHAVVVGAGGRGHHLFK